MNDTFMAILQSDNAMVKCMGDFIQLYFFLYNFEKRIQEIQFCSKIEGPEPFKTKLYIKKETLAYKVSKQNVHEHKRNSSHYDYLKNDVIIMSLWIIIIILWSTL